MAGPKPCLSVVVPVHNSRKTLEECLGALFGSDCRDFEVIVVDDGSTDDSADIVKKFPCRLITLKPNKGVAAARNRGVREARNEIVLFVDGDVVVRPDSLSRVMSFFSTNNDSDGVSGIYSVRNRFGNFLSQYKHLIVCYRERLCEDASRDSFKCSFVALKRSIFQKHAFDESFKKASIEDIEFGRELASEGYRIALDKSNDVEHVKDYTLRSFVRNQYHRSADLIKAWLGKKAYKFYMSPKRKNTYAKIYMLRAPISLAAFFLFILFLATGKLIFAAMMLLLMAAPIILERGFIGFCAKEKGALFAAKCASFYFIDGLICSGGIAKGCVEYFRRKH